MEQQHYLDSSSDKKLPGSINTLTILTFIGSGLGIAGAFWTLAKAKTSYETMQKMMNSDEFEKLPAMVRKMYSPEMLEATRKSMENRVPVFILTVVACILCIYGAMQMRKLKMMGYYAWLTGELLPFVTTILFIGIAPLTGISGIIVVGITLLFVILYTMQRKYLSA